LTDDQKAMLRLLAQREEGYDDMAALMGISVEEVRERVKEALAEVEEPPAPEEAPEAAAPPPPLGRGAQARRR
jgi:DNA-directed RNA polymerase specialized sigma24 family protein